MAKVQAKRMDNLDTLIKEDDGCSGARRGGSMQSAAKSMQSKDLLIAFTAAHRASPRNVTRRAKNKKMIQKIV